MDELHLDHERGARAILAANVEDRQLRADHQRQLLARQVFDGFNGPLARALEQIVEQPSQDLRVGREDAAEHEVILQVGEGHTPSLPQLPHHGKDHAGPPWLPLTSWQPGARLSMPKPS